MFHDDVIQISNNCTSVYFKINYVGTCLQSI